MDTESGVPIAWCELHDRKFNKAERLRFIEEAQMLKQLQHPNIVRFYEYWEDAKAKPKKIILVTELMTSGTLKAYVQRFSSTRLKVIKNFAIQILKGLAYLHSRSPPVIHRDLKCDNIFVTGQSCQVKIGDLGLATLKKASFAKSVIGTPEFMAPEMYSEQYDERIDVYAFGMCLLEMATGEYPYQECSKPFEIYKRVTSGVKPDNYNKIDNEDLKELIDLCIRLKSSERPQVKELLNHSWFMESNGLKLEILKDKNQQIIQKADGTITFRLKVNDKTKRKPNWPVWPDNEEIEFSFDVNNDDPEQIVKELKDKTNKICDEDLKYLTQAIKDKVCVFKLQTEDINEEETLVQNQTNVNEGSVLRQSLTKIDNVSEKTQILNENQKMLNESLALVNTNIDQSINSNPVESSMKTQNQQQAINSNNITSTVTQQPQVQTQTVKHVQFSDQIKNSDEASKEIEDKEIPFVLTIKDLSETAETGEVVHCILELDNREEIKFKFGLSADAPQQITNQLVNFFNSNFLN